MVGLDADPVHTAMASQYASARGLTNVEVATADARHTGLPSDAFDLVHARTLLVTIHCRPGIGSVRSSAPASAAPVRICASAAG